MKHNGILIIDYVIGILWKEWWNYQEILIIILSTLGQGISFLKTSRLMVLSAVVGITVLGGENSKRLDLGIYVKSVTEGGAAWKDGRLKAGKMTASTLWTLLPISLVWVHVVQFLTLIFVPKHFFRHS